jgi:hypothetical protein
VDDGELLASLGGLPVLLDSSQNFSSAALLNIEARSAVGGLIGLSGVKRGAQSLNETQNWPDTQYRFRDNVVLLAGSGNARSGRTEEAEEL